MSKALDQCPKCKKHTARQMVHVIVEADLSCRNLSKSGIRSKHVTVLGVGWDRATWFCANPRCGWLVRFDEHRPKKETK